MRLGGATIQDSKRIVIGLTVIHGIGKSSSYRICRSCDINPDGRAGDLNDQEIGRLKAVIDKHLTEGDLRRYVLSNIRRLMGMGCYRGMRHKRNLPARGQRTRTNSRTRRRTFPALKPKVQHEKRQK